VSSVFEFLKSFGLSRLAAIIGVTGGVAIALILIMVRIGEPQYSVLYSDLEYANAQTVITRLNQDGVAYRMRETGTRVAILVPRNRVSSLKISLAGSGFSANEGVGYEIFDGQQPLGTTSFQQNINRLRALEGELARTVTSITGVQRARVHLVLPERSLFNSGQQQASASIMLEASARLAPGTVRAIINLAASAVPELIPEQITVLDANGNLLASARTAEDGTMAEDAMADRMTAAELRLQQTVNDLVASIVGVDNVRTKLTADFDFSRFTETAEIVDPDSQVVLSSTIIEEFSDDKNPGRNQGVSIANALPGSQDVSNQSGGATSSNRRSEEVTNYEITKTVRNAVRDEGLVVNRLSAAVVINAADPEGNIIARSPEEISRIEALVKSAIGFDASRGDQVEVVNIAFTPVSALPVETDTNLTQAPQINEENFLRYTEIGVLLLIAGALVFFVLRPILTSTHHQNNRTTALINHAGAISEGQLQPLADNDTNITVSDHASPNMIEQKIKISQIEGQVKASSIKQIQEIVKGHKDESAHILKRWIREAI